jgi:hypothetical protein
MADAMLCADLSGSTPSWSAHTRWSDRVWGKAWTTCRCQSRGQSAERHCTTGYPNGSGAQGLCWAYEAWPGIPHFSPISKYLAYQYRALIIIPFGQASLCSSRRPVYPLPLPVYSLGSGATQSSTRTNKRFRKVIYESSQLTVFSTRASTYMATATNA